MTDKEGDEQSESQGVKGQDPESIFGVNQPGGKGDSEGISSWSIGIPVFLPILSRSFVGKGLVCLVDFNKLQIVPFLCLFVLGLVRMPFKGHDLVSPLDGLLIGSLQMKCE